MMIGLALGIIGVIALATLVLAFIFGLGGIARWLHSRTQVEVEINRGKAEEISYRRRVSVINQERTLDELMNGRALEAAKDDEAVKVKKGDITEPVASDPKERKAEARLAREAKFAEKAEVVTDWDI